MFYLLNSTKVDRLPSYNGSDSPLPPTLVRTRDTASVIARTSRTCLNIWAGDHRQTPGGLKNTVECRLFRQKLLQRPLALRCGTTYIQPHEMYRIVCRYLDGPWGSPSHQLKSLLEDADCPPRESKHMTAVAQLWCESLVKNRFGLTRLSVPLALLFCG